MEKIRREQIDTDSLELGDRKLHRPQRVAAAWLWKGNPFLGLVVGAAMAANTVVAVSIGGIVPLLLRRFNMDPALASGPIFTTITDMCGFFLIFSFAAATLPWLTA